MADEPVSPQQLIDNAAKALGETPIVDVPEEQKKEDETEKISPPVETPRIEEPATLQEPIKTEETTIPEIPVPVIPPIPEPVIQPTDESKNEETPHVEEALSQEVSNIPLTDVISPPSPPTPEPMIKEEEKKAVTITESNTTQEEQKTDNPPLPKQPNDKKSGKGVLIAVLLFFILTLPIAVYYITKSPQFAEIRSRAAAPCSKVNATTCQTVTCPKNAMSKAACEGDPGDLQHLCCKWTEPGQPTPTTRITLAPATATPTKKPASHSPTPTVISGCPGIKNWKPGKAPLTPSIKCNTNGTIHDFYGYCVFYHCPQGCGTGGCGEGDPGVWWEFGPCNSGKLNSTECGQIDTIFGNLSGGPGNYCIPETGCDALIQCGGSCTGGPTATPKPKTPTKTPTGTTAPTATPTGTTAPTATPTGTTAPTATPTGTTAPTATPTTTNTPAPGTCDASCDNDSNCESGLSCITSTGVKRCRKSACPDESDCSCPAATATPITYYAGNTPLPTRASLIASVPTATPTSQPTPKIPVAGVGPGIVGVLSVAGSIVLLLLGLVL